MTTAPSNLQPPDLGSVLTGFPDLSAYVAYGTGGASETVYVTFQIASNNTFTTAVQSVTTADLYVSGQTARGSLSTRLAPATWYFRARSTDQAGVNSAWSPTQSFAVAHQAFTSSHVPGNGDRVAYGNGTIRFSWLFENQDPAETQSAFQVRAYRASNDTVLFDTGKITSTAQFRDQAIAVGDQSGYYYWQVKVWDSYDGASVWSTPIMFQLSREPTVAIVAPTMNGTVNVPNPTFVWQFLSGNASPATYTSVDTAYGSYTALDTAQSTYAGLLGISPDQANQAAYKVVVTAGTVKVWDTGWVVSSAAQYTVPTNILVLNQNYEVTVWVRDSGGFEGASPASVFHAQWIGPDAPLEVVVDSSQTDTVGAVQIAWNAATYDPSFVEWRVYRRKVDLATGAPIGLWELVGTSTQQTGRGFVLDYLFEPNALYQYAAVQAAYRYYNDVIESVYNYVLVTPTSTHYWLICPDNIDLNVRLSSVAADTYTEEYESAEFHVINRGRRVEVGTRYGFNGSLTVNLRDDSEMNVTATEQKHRLESVKDARVPAVLRIPFGELVLVSIGSISFDRVSGVGMREFMTVTIPYMEVAA